MDAPWLAQMLAAREHLPEADLEQALQRQVIVGGSLDTNLLELNLATEVQLLTMMGEALGLPCVDRTKIDATDPKLAEIFPVVFAQTYHLVPHRLEGEMLHVLVASPWDEKLAARIQARLHLQVVPCMTCEVRLHYAMHRLYGTRLLPRYVTLLQKLDGQRVGASLKTFGRSEVERDLGWGLSNTRVSPLRSAAGEPVTRHDVRSQIARLDAAPDRDSMIDILLSFALVFFDFVGLFAVQGNRLQGWRGTDPHNTQQLAHFDLDLSVPSVFQTVAQTRGHYLGPMAAQPGNLLLLEHLNRPPPHVALVAPLIVGGKLAAILYADNAARAIGTKKVAALLLLTQRCGLCLEYLIRRRKRAASRRDSDAQKAALPATAQLQMAQSAANNTPADATPSLTPDPAADMALDSAESMAADMAADPTENTATDIAAGMALDPAENMAADIAADMAAGITPDSAHEMGADSTPESVPDLLQPVFQTSPEPIAENHAAQQSQTIVSGAYAASSGHPAAYSIGWDDVIAEAERAAALTPERFAAVKVMDTAVDRRDLLFDGLEADNPAARQSAVAGLLALGSSIDAELSKRFPGPLDLDPLQTRPRDLPPFARLNGLTELISARGPEGAACVLPHLDSDIAQHRWAAVYFLNCVHYPTACEALARRLYDSEPRIRSLAVDALTHYRAEAAYQRIISGLREQLRVPVVETQVAAIQILGQLREPSAVPALIPLVVTQNTLVARSAASALAVVCGQAYGSDLNQWQLWWQSNYTRPRTQWLMGGLSHSNSTIRRVAHGELQRLTGQVVPFQSDASADDQARLLQAWQMSLLPND